MTDKVIQYIKKETDFIDLFLLGAFCAVGLFNDYLCLFSCAVLFAYLIYEISRKKELRFFINLSSAAVAVIAVFYFLSVLWAVDSGEAFLGAFRYLSSLLFMLIAMQKTKDFDSYFNKLPVFAVFMTVVSAILSIISYTEDLVEIAGRLCGFFQYSNTFALFLLIAFIVTVTKEKFAVQDMIIVAVLLFGIIYSGSRTVFILLVLSILAVIIFSKNKKLKLTVGITVAAAIIIAVIIAFATDNFYSIGRFLTISFKESTFVGRLLYYSDALPVILKHPFGMGYMGYYFTQPSFQSGVYSVLSVHNDFLQLMLDIGWVPALLFVSAIVKTFFTKNTSFRKRLLLIVICAHSCFDFDLQYIAMLMLLILLLNFKEGEEREIKVKKAAGISALAVLTAVCLYLGISQTFSFVGKYEISTALYPLKTRDSIMLLIEETDVNKTEELADKIIKQNEYVAVAYSAKAKIDFSKGDVLSMMENKDKALETAVFQYEEYFDYCNLLIHAVKLFSEAGDSSSAAFCAEKLIDIEEQLNSNSEKLSYFGKQIKDQPITQLPDDIHEYIAELKNTLSL